MTTIAHYLLFAAGLFAIGSYGVLARRNLLIVLMSLELMLNGVNITLVALTLKFGAAPHGPEKLIKTPMTYLSIIIYPRR